MQEKIEDNTSANPIVKLQFDLKFHLPFFGEHTAVHTLPDFATFKYRFVQIEKLQESESFPEATATTIMMEYLDHRLLSGEVDEITASAFLNCLIFMNNYIDAYRLANKVAHLKNFNISDLPPVMLMEMGDSQVLYTLPQFSTITGTEMGTKEMSQLAIEKFMVWRQHRPFEIIDRFHSKAVHHLYTEEFIFAIIELQTSFEAYIRLCQHVILAKQDADEIEVERKLGMPLKNAIQHHLSTGLREDLNYETNSVMAKWNKTLYRLRNEIVHSGLNYISGNEAYEAFDAYQSCINYLSNLMVREKLITQDKMVNIDDLNKNIKENHDYDKTFAELKRRGILVPIITDDELSEEKNNGCSNQ